MPNRTIWPCSNGGCNVKLSEPLLQIQYYVGFDGLQSILLLFIVAIAFVVVIIGDMLFRRALSSNFCRQIKEFQKSLSPKWSFLRIVIINETPASQFCGKALPISSIDSYDSKAVVSFLHKSIHGHV